MEINFNKEFHTIVDSIDINNKPNIFLHVCCAPCFSGVLHRLVNYFKIYIIFSNSNIDTIDEFNLRQSELIKYLNNFDYDINIIYNDYDHNDFLKNICGLENEVEGGKRCEKCYEYRLKQSLDIALKYINNHNLVNQKNYLCTTLTISPHKDSNLINKIGINVCRGTVLEYLKSDYKKENGYLISINESKDKKLYRQIYCGCEFSKY